SRIYLHPACREGAGPPGEMDRRAFDQLSLRQPWPRAADPLRTGARQRGQVPRGQSLRLRQSRRLHYRRRAQPALVERRQEPRQRGKLRGIAIGSYLEVTAPPGVELGKIVFEDDGSVRLITGTLDYGQGHATPFAQVLCAQLGVPFESVKLEQGDSDIVHTGSGTGGSRSITASGMAIVGAAKLVIEKGKRAAAHMLEASEA